MYSTISFELSMMMMTTELYSLIHLEILDVHAWSQFYMTSKTLVSIFSQSIDLNEIQFVATTCWFVEADAKFIWHK